jgi:hypothetical protein
LTLTNGQVATAAGDACVKRNLALVYVGLESEKTSCAESIIQGRIIILMKGIKIVSQRSAEKFGLEGSEKI